MPQPQPPQAHAGAAALTPFHVIGAALMPSNKAVMPARPRGEGVANPVHRNHNGSRAPSADSGVAVEDHPSRKGAPPPDSSSISACRSPRKGGPPGDVRQRVRSQD